MKRRRKTKSNPTAPSEEDTHSSPRRTSKRRKVTSDDNNSSASVFAREEDRQKLLRHLYDKYHMHEKNLNSKELQGAIRTFFKKVDTKKISAIIAELIPQFIADRGNHRCRQYYLTSEALNSIGVNLDNIRPTEQEGTSTGVSSSTSNDLNSQPSNSAASPLSPEELKGLLIHLYNNDLTQDTSLTTGNLINVIRNFFGKKAKDTLRKIKEYLSVNDYITQKIPGRTQGFFLTEKTIGIIQSDLDHPNPEPEFSDTCLQKEELENLFKYLNQNYTMDEARGVSTSTFISAIEALRTNNIIKNPINSITILKQLTTAEYVIKLRQGKSNHFYLTPKSSPLLKVPHEAEDSGSKSQFPAAILATELLEEKEVKRILSDLYNKCYKNNPKDWVRTNVLLKAIGKIDRKDNQLNKIKYSRIIFTELTKKYIKKTRHASGDKNRFTSEALKLIGISEQEENEDASEAEENSNVEDEGNQREKATSQEHEHSLFDYNNNMQSATEKDDNIEFEITESVQHPKKQSSSTENNNNNEEETFWFDDEDAPQEPQNSLSAADKTGDTTETEDEIEEQNSSLNSEATSSTTICRKGTSKKTPSVLTDFFKFLPTQTTQSSQNSQQIESGEKSKSGESNDAPIFHYTIDIKK